MDEADSNEGVNINSVLRYLEKLHSGNVGCFPTIIIFKLTKISMQKLFVKPFVTLS